MRLAKEDSMVDDGPILTANSHGDRFLCNKRYHKSIIVIWWFKHCSTGIS